MKLLLICEILNFVFFSLGGWCFLDVVNHPYLTIVTVGAIAAVLVSVFLRYDDRIEQLEKKVAALEEAREKAKEE